MDFKKYQHVERFGTSEVQGIEFGECYIFPKIDGTNSSVWIDDGVIKCGSRKRFLSLEADNAGFCLWAISNQKITNYLKDNPTHRLYGEWLVPHSLKTYKESAWREFYVFDVTIDKSLENTDHNNDELKYIHYNTYKPILEKYGVEYIPPIAILKQGTYEQLIKQLEKNVFLIEDGKGFGEGIVIKNYDYFNKYGRQTWAKIVTSEFKEKHTKEMGAPEIKGKSMIEEKISDKYVTTALCEKVKSKIENTNNGFSNRMIPQLLNTIYHDLIIEESWNIIKEFKNPTVNYKTLQHFVFKDIRNKLSEVF